MYIIYLKSHYKHVFEEGEENKPPASCQQAASQPPGSRQPAASQLQASLQSAVSQPPVSRQSAASQAASFILKLYRKCFKPLLTSVRVKK